MSVLIKKISAKGYKKFDEKIEINFETNPNKYNLKGTIRTIDNLSLNSVIGIIGPNASGKTTAIEMLVIYRSLLNQGPTIKDPYLNFKPLVTNDLINNKTNKFELEVELYIEEEKITLIHTMIFGKDLVFEERLHIKNKTIYENKERLSVYTKGFTEKYLNIGKINKIEEKSVLIAQELFKLSLSITARHIEDNGRSSADIIDFLYNFKNITEANKLLHFILELALKTVDPQIESLPKLLDKKYDINEFALIKINLKDNDEIYYQDLSTGTKKFFDLILNIVVSIKVDELNLNSYNYFIIDEIDSSWHPHLTFVFINLFKMNFLKNNFLVFTAHNPYIFDFLRKDAIIISEGNKLTSLNNFKNGDTYVRNDLKFSKNYYNDIFFENEIINEDIIEKIENITSKNE